MTVLVTGATGFLGSHVAVALHKAGVPVVTTGRNAGHLARLSAMGLRVVHYELGGDIPVLVADQFGPLRAVVHCAGLSSPWAPREAFVAANVEATSQIADLAERQGATRFVHVSTASVYFRFADQDRLTEDQVAPEPVNDYARTKLAAERIVLDRQALNPVVIRPRGIYGAGDTALLPRLMRVARRAGLPRFDRMGATDITHVDDVVAAIMRALETDVPGEVINVGGGVALPLTEIIEAACAQTGVKPRWLRLPFGPTLGAVRAMEAVARRLPGQPEPPVTAYGLGILRYRQSMDIAKAERLLGWTPQVSFAEGLSRTFADGALRPGVI